MDEESTTAKDNQEIDPNATDQQTANDGDNLDTSNQNDATSTGDDKTNSEDTTKQTDTPAKFDDDLDEWMEKRKLPKAESDEQRQAYQDLRNSQREYTRTQQAKKDSESLGADLDKQREDLHTEDDDDDTLDEYDRRLRAVEADRERERTTRLQSEFYSENKVTPEEHEIIKALITEKVNRGTSNEAKLRLLDTWGSPDALSDLLDIAQARLSKTTNNAALTEEVQRAERERIAKESNANSNSRSAKVTQTGDKTPEQERLERFSDWSK